MGNFASFQHHMIDGPLAQTTAHCQTGVPGADNDCGDVANGGRSQSGAAIARGDSIHYDRDIRRVGHDVIDC